MTIDIKKDLTVEVVKREPRNLFKKRVKLKPYEYPELLPFKDAITHAFWIWSEYNYQSDVHHFKVDINDKERNAITNSMLAISQIEVTVKRFWSDLYNYFPKPEIDMVGVTFGECHIAGTEVLTPTGWVDFRDIKVGDLVLQYNENGTSNFTPVLAVHNSDHKGVMYRFIKDDWSMVVTPNHRMVYRNENGELLEESAEKYNVTADKHLPFTATKVGIENELTFLERLAVILHSEGYTRVSEPKDYTEYVVTVKTEDKKQRLSWALENLQDTVEYQLSGDVTDTKGCVFNIKVSSETDLKGFDWLNLSYKSNKWANEYLDELTLWGCNYLSQSTQDTKTIYATTCKKHVDIIQAIGILAGYNCTMSIHKDTNYELSTNVYRVSFLKDNQINQHGISKEQIKYDGTVHCVTVESGVLFTRYNNQVSISGNSEVRHLETYSKLLELLGMDDKFNDIDNIPQLTRRIEYMDIFMLNKNRDDQGFVLSLVLFSLFIEHISLYSQFFTIQSFNKHRNLFKGISNAISASFLDEDTHGKFGIALYHILKEEHSELFTEELYEDIINLSKEAFEAEMDIVDWIFEAGDLDFIDRATVKNYVKYRYNKSFKSLGLPEPHVLDDELTKKAEWFELEVTTTKDNDFFNKRSTDYTKRSQSVTGDDLF